MKLRDKLIIDFDSTFVDEESLDILAQIATRNHPEKPADVEKIKHLTSLGMAGEISFEESISERLKCLNANRKDLEDLILHLINSVSRSIEENKDFFFRHAEDIYIVSSGFKEFIEPVCKNYGISSSHVFANTFVYDYKGNIVGLDESNPLSNNQGKVKLLKSLKFGHDVVVIGDGITDYEIREAGLARKFVAYTENVKREAVCEKADFIAESWNDILLKLKLNPDFYQKKVGKALLLENVHHSAKKLLVDAGFDVELLKTSLDEQELCEKIKDVQILGIRSKTMVTAKVLESANELIAIGAFCIGTNQIDLDYCIKHGIAVFNAPFSNTRSVVELALAEIILLMRNLPDSMRNMHRGVWKKSADRSHEIRGKKLGIVGYGNIGSQLSILAESVGMDVYFYDVEEKLALGNATKCASMVELLRLSDVVSLHVDGRATNTHLIGEDELNEMKDGAILINLSRGHVVDLNALVSKIDEGKIKGLGVDVFPEEPKSNNEHFDTVLKEKPNTILTSHIGGSTIEAQIDIAHFVPQKLKEYVMSGSTMNNVTLPELQIQPVKNAHRLIHMHKNKPGMLADVNQALARYDVNILSQALKTNEQIGYLIISTDKNFTEEIVEELKNIDGTIRLRMLY
ncbi:phosphoglycerate dehydrogenase [Aureibacter tunicatorum]|uniref:D-3-phosphoglycerate dehydrogenase n=1 Tax=Aureibacter tunicatorum TaxID=866807 RepID=A0AAE3XKV4_9BACT|nr:phosphoglycerate dehydrogenase [Aureibacter tunicatorum]MDR6239706.1 D-3-phosphoglycerate dehydrogenase [Aureibacter tunicatorum]BDD04182.1 hypothetical protein AUTU_16650 [Aureibacter tunicatorum]